MAAAAQPFSWASIARLGLVQTALGAIVVLTTSTMNRVMAVELALPAMLPGILVAIHYAVQLSRPRWGHGSDVGGRRTPWIIGGMAALTLGGALAAVSIAWMETSLHFGIALAVLAFVLIGMGVGAAGTSLLVLLAKNVVAERRAAAATVVWVMMIVGFIVTAATAGHFLDPYSPARLVAVTSAVAVIAFTLALVAVWGVEPPAEKLGEAELAAPSAEKVSFMVALIEAWRDTQARRFTFFVFLSMFAYSAQDLILEPFAGTIFGLTPGASTKLAGLQHSGVLTGMVAIAVIASHFAKARTERWRKLGSLGLWTVAGCLASALALVALSIGGHAASRFPLHGAVFLLGFSNGVFAVAAIGSMMALAGEGHSGAEGMRMGLWGAAQAIAFGLGGFLGAAGADLVRALSGSPLTGYASVFAAEAALFIAAALLAAHVWRLGLPASGFARPRLSVMGESVLPAGTSRP